MYSWFWKISNSPDDGSHSTTTFSKWPYCSWWFCLWTWNSYRRIWRFLFKLPTVNIFNYCLQNGPLCRSSRFSTRPVQVLYQSSRMAEDVSGHPSLNQQQIYPSAWLLNDFVTRQSWRMKNIKWQLLTQHESPASHLNKVPTTKPVFMDNNKKYHNTSFNCKTMIISHNWYCIRLSAVKMEGRKINFLFFSERML